MITARRTAAALACALLAAAAHAAEGKRSSGAWQSSVERIQGETLYRAATADRESGTRLLVDLRGPACDAPGFTIVDTLSKPRKDDELLPTSARARVDEAPLHPIDAMVAFRKGSREVLIELKPEDPQRLLDELGRGDTLRFELLNPSRGEPIYLRYGLRGSGDALGRARTLCLDAAGHAAPEPRGRREQRHPDARYFDEAPPTPAGRERFL